MLLICRHGLDMNAYSRKVNRLSLQETVEFLGSLPSNQVRRLYRRAHLFILPSVTASNGDKEGQGLVLQEAQAMGLPVISTRHNGIPEGVLDGESGFLVPEKDPKALEEKILYELANPNLWGPLGRRGHKFVAEKYDIKILNKQLEQIYQEAVEISQCRTSKSQMNQKSG